MPSTISRDLFDPYVPEFLNHLRTAGCSDSHIPNFPGSVKHFLVWLQLGRIGIGKIDNAVLRRFRNHHCRCPRPKGERYLNSTKRDKGLMSRVLRFVRFLEESGRIETPCQLNERRDWMERFLSYIDEHRYAPSTVKVYRRHCHHFIVWLHQSRIPMVEVDRTAVDRFMHHDCICHGFFVMNAVRNRSYRYIIERFVSFLVLRGVVPGVSPMPRNELAEGLKEFGTWLRQHRGIAETTLQTHVKKVAALLPDLGEDPERYDAASIRDALLRRFEHTSRTDAQHTTTSLRMYLRYLVANDRCSAALIGAIPTVPRWRLSTLPRYILDDDVERVIASCDVTTRKGIRDRAILLLLARLALRAGDVVNLCLSDIDWANAIVRVGGKSKRSVGLPLPQDAGDALFSYIEQARPRADIDRVFLRSIAPCRPLSSSSAVTVVVREALKRADVRNVNLRGAQLLRHSAATNLLRSGATLEAVGTLLRHRSPETTSIYAKVDTRMLQEVAQPWIGDAR